MHFFQIPSGANQLRGYILKPKNTPDSRLPAVIVSHGFASNMMISYQYARVFVKQGYAAVCFDFCMSGSGVSTGSSLDMSVLTEVEDLLTLLDYVKTLPFVDKEHIVLAGCSQGGLVSALAAAKRPADISALVLYYPALCIPDDARRGRLITARFDPQQIPEKFYAISVHLSKKYALDARTLDPYRQICTYSGPVLIVHGLEDVLVKIDYSRRAEQAYAHAKLVEVHGDHGFIAKGFGASAAVTTQFLQLLARHHNAGEP